MGGNVFSDKTRRYEANEYYIAASKFIDRFENVSGVIKSVVIPAYEEKESFGDMDILYTSSTALSLEELNKIFECNGNISKNGDVISLIYNGDFQVDVIRSTPEEFNYSLNYFSFNDRGNLVGKIAHKLGLKHGHKGLLLPVRTEHTLLGEIVLTRSPAEAELFLDVLPSRSNRFKKREDVFTNIVSSYYFNPSIFSFEEMNAVARVRDKKRSTYNLFLKYIEKMDGTDPVFFKFSKDKSEYLPMIFDYFPSSEKEYNSLILQKKMVEDASLKFNGNLVREWSGLEGKDLGRLMTLLKPRMAPNEVVKMSDAQIKETVLASVGKEIKL